MSCFNSIAHTQETYFGDTWIVDENISDTAGNITKLKDRPLAENGANANPNVPRPPYIVPNLGLVDTWKCGCDVCTGNLLQYARGVTSRAYLEEYPTVDDEEDEEAEHEYTRYNILVLSSLTTKSFSEFFQDLKQNRLTDALDSQVPSNGKNQNKADDLKQQVPSVTPPVESKPKAATKSRLRL